MRDIDYTYIAENISSLSRIATRVYEGRECVASFDPSHFPVDPATPYLDQFFEIDQEVSYYITPYDQFYGIIHYDNHSLIIGPTYEMTPSRSAIREFMFTLGLKENYYPIFQDLMAHITPMPLELFLHELCLIYYFISEKKLTLADFPLYDSYSDITRQNQPFLSEEKTDSYSFDSYEEAFTEHTTFDFEKQMLSCITAGDVPGLQALFSSGSSGRPGKTSSNYLRQIRNIFISSVTLCSRAAIEGGLPAEEALTLSDRYIQHSEVFDNPEQIMNLQSHMVQDFASLVAELNQGKRYNKFMRSVTEYVREHLTEDLSVEKIAKDLYVSRSYLSAKFKKESGMTLNSYITDQKIKKSMEYLKHTDKTILEISTFLGFSSQGYFQNVFKKHTGMTPGEYRSQ